MCEMGSLAHFFVLLIFAILKGKFSLISRERKKNFFELDSQTSILLILHTSQFSFIFFINLIAVQCFLALAKILFQIFSSCVCFSSRRLRKMYIKKREFSFYSRSWRENVYLLSIKINSENWEKNLFLLWSWKTFQKFFLFIFREE